MPPRNPIQRSAPWNPNYFELPPQFRRNDELVLATDDKKLKLSYVGTYDAPLTASSGGFGPGRDLPLNFSKTVRIDVAAGLTVQMGFGYAAWWENATDLYDQNYSFWDERGNYGRSGADFPVPPKSYAYYFFLTAWNKQSPPDSDYSWIQSEFIGADHPQPNVIIAKFRDGGNSDPGFANQTIVVRAL